ncbi:hypothetical protein H7F33_02580 [Pedobacter sp. PAMC26386]|nr:hypothetical protein H7F33_02580 [Pedobacter sp. PAMC26386]
MTQTNTLKWSFSEKILFRFVFLFLIPFVLIINNGIFPLLYLVTQYPLSLLQQFIPWIAKNYLSIHYRIDVSPTGSGDTTFHYLQLLLFTSFSLVGTLIWTLIDQKRISYNTLYYWLTVAVRFYLAFTLINYGMVKVIKLQFPFPGSYRLIQAYGNSSPMGLAWTFLGFSKGYNLFMGIAELLGALLLFRKTITIGSIIALMTTANVMAINYFYDVPVKILSTALVVMCIFLLAPNFRILFDFFIKGKAAVLKVLTFPQLQNKWANRAVYGLKYLFICYSFLFIIFVTNSREYGDRAPKSPLYGVYTVDTFIKNKDTIPQDSKETWRWKYLMMQGTKNSAIQYMNEETDYVEAIANTTTQKLSIVFNEDKKNINHLRYQVPDQNHLILQGHIYGDSIIIKLTKKEFELTKREFNWISEQPFNR